MIEIIREAYTEEKLKYELVFRHYKSPDGGYAFPCDKDGRVAIKDMQHAGIVNYIRCCLGSAKKLGVREHVETIRHSNIGKCGCGREISLDNFTNECECGALYNWCGQELRPRNEWEEDMYDEYYDDQINEIGY